MKESKRLDDIDPNMELSPVLISNFHKVLLGGGIWTSKNRKSMMEKYYLSRKQYNKMEAPTLKGT